MAGLARRLAPAAALGGIAIVIVGVADPALAGRSATPSADTEVASAPAPAVAAAPETTPAQPDTTPAQPDTTPAQPDTATDTAASCDAGTTVTGDEVMTRWGPVQVSATVAGGRVCEVHAVAWPTGDPRSQAISSYAIPQLDQSATQSQGTQLDYVSGATYTSNGYAQSLQSILDSL